MAIQTAATANADSITNIPLDGVIFESAAAIRIDGAITIAKNNPDDKVGGVFITMVEFIRRNINGFIEIEQSDDSWVSLPLIIDALSDRGFRTSVVCIHTNKLKLTIAWD